jgi:hypothetical protein
VNRVLSLALAGGLGLACVGIVTLPPAVAQPADQGVAKIVSSWKARQDAFKSVRYTLSGSQILSSTYLQMAGRLGPGQAMREAPSQEVRRPEGGVVLFDFEKNYVRIERQTSLASGSGPAVVPHDHTYAYGGRELKMLYPRAANTTADYTPSWDRPDLVLLKASDPNLPPFELRPVFWAHGIVPLPQTPLRADNLRPAPDPDLLIGRGEAVYKQRTYRVVRSEAMANTSGGNYDEYWVDVGRQAAIVKSTMIVADKPTHVYEVDYALKDGAWLPSGWTYTHYLAGKLMQSYRLTVSEIRTNLPTQDVDFDIPVEPGMLVAQGDQLSRADERGRLQPLSGEEARAHQRQLDLAKQSHGSTPLETESLWHRVATWTIVASGGLVVALLALFLARRYRAKERGGSH